MLFDRTDLINALTDFKTIVEPEKDEENWWAGAPSVVFDAKDHKFWLAVRMRTGEGRRGSRGYEIRILNSNNGEDFSIVKKIHRKEMDVQVFERPALIMLPNKKFRLYGCSSFLGQWVIWKLDDVEYPMDLDPTTMEIILHPPLSDGPSAALKGYKDPFVIWYKNKWHLTVNGEAHKTAARPYHFISHDGFEWAPWPNDVVNGKPATFFETTGWHNWVTRPACLIPLKIGVLLIYEGAHLNWHDAVYNLATGMAYSPDLTHWHDLTPDEPLLKSTTPGDFHTWRYSHWLPVEGEMYVYWEGARANNTFATRMAKFPLDDALNSLI
ncbi:MAG: hypothetical protein GF364_02475 [Candidatus Lokiarchaeota archaeon]|nr:hypothetical protein [Candidatus Lokiarchaeota archaeon]